MLKSLILNIRRATWSAFSHSTFTNAKAAAYSAILSLFPALLVVTTLLALSPETDTFRGELRAGFSELLPPDTMSLVQAYFQSNHARSVHLIWTSSLITIGASMGVMLSLMEGFRRAYLLPRGEWGFWRERVVALALVPGTLVPMIFATGLVAFGHVIEGWMIDNTDHELRFYVVLAGRILRWGIAMLTSVVVLGVIYHFGTPRKRPWRQVVPGATLATATWFLATLIYGWYLTRYADYSVVYGSLGAGVATLVWLYMVCFSILIGAEFNAQIFPIVPRPQLAPDEHTISVGS
ncbi:membrane protein [Silvibacterium bohemicum]|uniref:Membrane protein n=1 Tax=Silvibacterium bohemicum TaxID=1577686 RepID=A0A841JX48_9BACT|nr:YihY/virulence factor BrkB family protein [Silvibacterium bohemicum]MBB6145926.1 membrane protein [Silvibacterium bohemicum]